MARKFEAYFRDGRHGQASDLVRRRYEHVAQYHLPLNDIARTEIGGSVALLINTIPATFWLLWRVLSDPVVFRDCQQELVKGVWESNDVCTIDVCFIKTDCPVFLLTLKEVLRFHDISNSIRIVIKDCTLDDQYLLKKGSVVMMPGPVQHSIPSIWGPDVAEFSHKRFVPLPDSSRPNPVAFRGFGGGNTLCPGRHCATCDILAFAALTILQFEIQPAGGEWVRPTVERTSMAPVIPRRTMMSRLQFVRGAVSDGLLLSELSKAMEISAEDMATGADGDKDT